MDGNKEEALRCLRIAEDAVASGDKGRALKFINLAKRLYPSLSADDLLAACNKLDPVSVNSSLEGIPESVGGDKLEPDKVDEKSENAELIRRLRRSDDYYAILGVKKTCSDEEIRKAYRKLSLKVHPDKNKAPGSEEAFKKVLRAFTCLSDGNSRKQYDQVGLVDEFDHIKRRYRRPRRRRKNTQTDFFEDDFDPDEIFREFFGQADTFRPSHAYRNRRTRHQPPQEEDGPSFLTFLQILPFLLLFLLAYLPFSEPDYALHKNQSYQIPKTTQNHGIDFYVRSSAFDEKFPLGSSAQFNIEDRVIKEYRNFLFHSCRVELQKRRWNKKLPTPHCNELQGMGFVERVQG